MKKRFLIGLVPLVLIAVAAGFARCHSVGWYRGDPLDYIKENFHPDGAAVTGGEYLATGMDGEGGYVVYEVTTEHGNTHYVRLHVEFHRTLRRIGPDYKIKGLSELESFENPLKEVYHEEKVICRSCDPFGDCCIGCTSRFSSVVSI